MDGANHFPFRSVGDVTKRNALWASTSAKGGMASFVSTMRETQLWSDWHIRIIWTHDNGHTLRRLVIFGFALVEFAIRLLANRPDVVHLHVSQKGSFFRKAILAWTCFAIRTPVIIHIHGSSFHIFADSASSLGRHFIRRTLERADVVAALGNVWADRIRALAPLSQVVVLPNAVQPERSIGVAHEGPVTFAFLGQIGERKGAFSLLNAWANLLASLPADISVRLIMAGDGEVERARRVVEELGATSTVEVVGWLSRREAQHLLDRADVLVLPSENEGQPMAILEAMAKGLCVIATEVGGIPEMIGENAGLLIPPGDQERLEEALMEAATDSTGRRILGLNAHQRVVCMYSVEALAQKIDEMYTTVTERKRRARAVG